MFSAALHKAVPWEGDSLPVRQLEQKIGPLPLWLFVVILSVVGLGLIAIFGFWYVKMKRQESERLRVQLELKMYHHEKKKAERAARKMQAAHAKHLQAQQYQPVNSPYDGGPQQPPVNMNYMTYTPTQAPIMQMQGPAYGVEMAPMPMGGQGVGYTVEEYGGVLPYGYGMPTGPPQGMPRSNSFDTMQKDEGNYRIRRASSYSDLPHGPAPVPPPGFVAVPMIMEPTGNRPKQGRKKGRKSCLACLFVCSSVGGSVCRPSAFRRVVV